MRRRPGGRRSRRPEANAAMVGTSGSRTHSPMGRAASTDGSGAAEAWTPNSFQTQRWTDALQLMLHSTKAGLKKLKKRMNSIQVAT